MLNSYPTFYIMFAFDDSVGWVEVLVYVRGVYG